jgi:ABC-type sugar transport system permease subunit
MAIEHRGHETRGQLGQLTYARRNRLLRGDFLSAMLFILPWIIGFAWFQLYPIAASFYYSFTSYNMMQPPHYVGIENYTRLFTEDDLFRKSLTNTAIYTLFSVPLGLTVAFLFALLLNREIPGRALFRAIF